MKGKKILGFILTLSICLCFFVGCKQTSIDDIAKGLTNYSLSLSFDDQTKTLKGEQTVDYINSTNTSLNEVWFHLYPNAFAQGVSTKPVSLSYKEKAYPNGEDFGSIEVESVKVGETSKQVNVGGVENQVLMVVSR